MSEAFIRFAHELYGEAIDSTFVSSVGAFVTENAAFGVAQMERLPGLLASKRKVAAAYAQWCGAHGGSFVAEPAGAHSNYWLNALRLRNETERDAFLAATHQAGVMTRPLWTPMHRLPMYAACRRGVLPATERLASTLVNIPSSART